MFTMFTKLSLDRLAVNIVNLFRIIRSRIPFRSFNDHPRLIRILRTTRLSYWVEAGELCVSQNTLLAPELCEMISHKRLQLLHHLTSDRFVASKITKEINSPSQALFAGTGSAGRKDPGRTALTS